MNARKCPKCGMDDRNALCRALHDAERAAVLLGAVMVRVYAASQRLNEAIRVECARNEQSFQPQVFAGKFDSVVSGIDKVRITDLLRQIAPLKGGPHGE